MRRKRSMFWKVLAVGGVALLLLAGLALPAAAGWVTTHPLGSGTVSVTNNQANSVWMPVTVLLRYEAPASALVAVARESQGNIYLLGLVGFTNALSVVWIPETDYPFVHGDVLQLYSTAKNGQLQVIRTGK